MPGILEPSTNHPKHPKMRLFDFLIFDPIRALEWLLAGPQGA